MANFEIPDWAMAQPGDAPPSPPPDPAMLREQQIADNTRAEQALNGFIAAKQSALFEAPDAFYRAQGEDAIHALPVATQKLDDLRRDLLDRLGNDTQRERLADALFTQVQDQLDPEHAAPLQGQLDAGPMMVLPYRPSPDDGGIETVPLPYKLPMDGTLDEALMLENLTNVPEGENAPGQMCAKSWAVNPFSDVNSEMYRISMSVCFASKRE